MTYYIDDINETKNKLDKISSSMCMAKWFQVSLHLPNGKTHSCFHPPARLIPLTELEQDPGALHNTKHKQVQRQKMLNGERPRDCEYCWKIEDAGHLSDRHYRSAEWWAQDGWNEIKNTDTILPRYVEVNFNQACNFKCVYCSPHLSTTWEKEIKECGPYELSNIKHNDTQYLDMPFQSSNDDNPYVKAFWNWWPELYKTLKVFRMTGGEPLIDNNTYKILDYVIKNPNTDLELSITSNLCPPDNKIINRFINKIKKIEQIRWWEDPNKINKEYNNNNFVGASCKHFSLFVSLDSVGEQAEYIRYPLNYNILLDNIHNFLENTITSEICFINTFNLLSIPKLKDFLQLILDLRIKFGKDKQKELKIQPPDRGEYKHPPVIIKSKQRIWFDIPMLDHPKWLNATVIAQDKSLLPILNDCLKFMKDNVEREDYHKTGHGFKKYEIEKLERNIDLIKQDLPNDIELKNFYLYFKEIDKRRNLNFKKTFPELEKLYEKAKRITREL